MSFSIYIKIVEFSLVTITIVSFHPEKMTAMNSNTRYNAVENIVSYSQLHNYTKNISTIIAHRYL